jgi:hypothetical protein
MCRVGSYIGTSSVDSGYACFTSRVPEWLGRGHRSPTGRGSPVMTIRGRSDCGRKQDPRTGDLGSRWIDDQVWSNSGSSGISCGLIRWRSRGRFHQDLDVPQVRPPPVDFGGLSRVLAREMALLIPIPSAASGTRDGTAGCRARSGARRYRSTTCPPLRPPDTCPPAHASACP